MKLKVGDKVRVKSLEWYNKNKDCDGDIGFGNGPYFTKLMSEFCGKETTIKRIDGEAYVLDIDKLFLFAEDSVEPIIQDNSLNVLKGCTLETNCITLQDGQTAKISVENGKTKIMIENKEVKEEEPLFKKGDILSYTEVNQTWYIIFKGIDERKILNKLEYYCMLNSDCEITLNSTCGEDGWNYATEEEKRTLFLAMLNKGMFWDEKKMKVRTLKDGDIVTIKANTDEYWQSIFKEIKDGKFYSYSDLDCDKKLYKGPLGEVNQILSIRYATFKERQTLFDKIEEQEHKKWNTETKKFEDIRWRAKSGETYWYLTENFHVAWHTEVSDSTDKALGDVNNKFQTKELAEAAANKIKELLSKL